jgi:hypothetical protein
LRVEGGELRDWTAPLDETIRRGDIIRMRGYHHEHKAKKIQ